MKCINDQGTANSFINTFGQTVKESGLTEVVQFDVMPLQADRSLRLEAYVVPEISHISNEHIEVVKNDYPHLHLHHINCNKS